MEINEISNSNLKQNIADATVGVLLNNNLIVENELQNYQIQFGYIFTKEDGVLEALMKAICNDKVFYFAFQKGSLMLINITENQYNETINYMKANHVCLNDNSKNETEKQKNRRQKNNKFLTQNGISINENLLYKDNNIQLKNMDDICKRALACLITTQIACDIPKGHYKRSLEFFLPLYDKFGVKNSLNSKEKKIIAGTYSNQDAIDMDWAYESYWAICWCLSLVDDIKNGGELCDCHKAIAFVRDSSSFEDFKSKCNLRNIDEIMDMSDLYYRYNWAINNKLVDSNTNIGNLRKSNVIERRRALEWIISDVDDWYDLHISV